MDSNFTEFKTILLREDVDVFSVVEAEGSMENLQLHKANNNIYSLVRS